MNHCPESLENEISGQYMLQSHAHFGLVIVFIWSQSLSNQFNCFCWLWLLFLETTRSMIFLLVAAEKTPATALLAISIQPCRDKISKLSLMTNLTEEMKFQSHLWKRLKHQPFQLSFSLKTTLLPDGVLMNLRRSSSARKSMHRLCYRFSIALIHQTRWFILYCVIQWFNSSMHILWSAQKYISRSPVNSAIRNRRSVYFASGD